MLLAFLLACFVCGSYGVTHEELCFGQAYRFPFQYTPPLFTGKIYFTPKGSESKRLLVDNGEAKDPRVKILHTSMSLQELTEQDEGIFSVQYDYSPFNIVSLKILDCADKVEKYYHGMYRIEILSSVHILEFTPIGKPDQTTILWNRTDPKGRQAVRGQFKNNYWEISDLTQDDSGYYNLRRKSYGLLSRKKLAVTEQSRSHEPKEGATCFIQYPSSFVPWDVTFTPSREGDDKDLMVAGNWEFKYRLHPDSYGLEIFPVESKDSGLYEFRDKDGHLGLSASLDVEEAHAPTYVYIILSVVFIAGVAICCCCIRRSCCKKKASKTNTPQLISNTPTTPAVYYHGPTQPTGTSYPAAAYSYQPSPAPAAVPAPAALPAYQPYKPVFNTVVVHPSPGQLETVVSGGHDSAPGPTFGSGFLSSDPGPRFELKGMNFSSALSSDADIANVYTSKKLSFK
ncbi:wu:fc21g02 isoform X2 [Entelurus aequoreus]|uniref:wu:fc21g02 isoform X2 n=1 Tax=Entelurus aequoreus TaxID=161455 RepID=UPI002B1DBA85|nr:wu:fc21g02 isoform X2 [Entelurus aequoreus]